MSCPMSSWMRHTKNTMEYRVSFRFHNKEEGERIIGFLKGSGMQFEHSEGSYSIHAVIPSLGHADPCFSEYSNEFSEFSYMTPEMVENALLLYPDKRFWCRGIYHGFTHNGLVQRNLPENHEEPEESEEPLY